MIYQNFGKISFKSTKKKSAFKYLVKNNFLIYLKNLIFCLLRNKSCIQEILTPINYSHIDLYKFNLNNGKRKKRKIK